MKKTEKKSYSISVHQFVDMVSVGGDLSTGAVSTRRMQQGIQTHIKRQEEQNKISEFALDYILEGTCVKIHIKGKADIVDKSREEIAIEEIKTHFGKIADKKTVNDEHLAQCKCYCAMYVLKHNQDNITARIAYIEYESDEVKLFEYRYTKDEILDWFNEKLNYILDIFERRQEHINRRNLSAREIKFPFGNYRAGQKELATYVFRGCKTKNIQFLQAPTGIGKTMGTIYPAVKAFAYEEYERLFYATAKNTIKQIAEEAIAVLRKKGLIINSITLTAKEASCPQTVYNCHPKVCPRARGYYNRLGMAMDDFEENKHYNINDIRKTADKYTLCPFELSLDYSLECDAIICDYNNIYDPRAKLKRFFDDGGDYVVLIDEAHNLAGRAREMYSGEINKELYKNLAEKMTKVRSKRAKTVLENTNIILKYLDTEINDLVSKDTNYEIIYNPLDVLNKMLEKFCESAEAILDLSSTREYTDDLQEAFYTTKGYLHTVAKSDDNYIHYIYIEKENVSLKMFCIDPSQRLQECHDKSKETVLFSASLTPFKYYTRLLQRVGGCETHELESPFPKENLKLLVNGYIPVEYKYRDQYIQELVNNIYAFVKAKKGRYLIFFPSYGYMEKAHKLFIALYDDVFAPKQERNMDGEAREAFISLFSEDSHMAAFAVMGGIFSEGIDLKGEKLIGAVIVGTGFPMISLENNFIRDFHNSREEEGLGYAYIYPGFNKVLQSVGRVIRSEKDKGAVLLIDRRFAKQEYIDLMPSWWKPLEYVDDFEDIKEKLNEFWSKK